VSLDTCEGYLDSTAHYRTHYGPICETGTNGGDLQDCRYACMSYSHESDWVASNMMGKIRGVVHTYIYTLSPCRCPSPSPPLSLGCENARCRLMFPAYHGVLLCFLCRSKSRTRGYTSASCVPKGWGSQWQVRRLQPGRYTEHTYK
jgi:hypothetical protein